MTPDAIRTTIRDAVELIARAKRVLKETKTYAAAEYISPSMHSAALRRQSLELTRSLAAMRRP